MFQGSEMSSPHYSLRWNNHQSHLLTAFDTLLQNETLVDVTLVCEETSFKAHKVVLSACSPYFQRIFSETPCKHPVIVLKDLRGWEVQAIVDFMYRGEISVGQEQLSSLIKAAESLQVRGLAHTERIPVMGSGEKEAGAVRERGYSPPAAPPTSPPHHQFNGSGMPPPHHPMRLPQIPHLPNISFNELSDRHCTSPTPRRKQARPRRRSGDASIPQDLSKPLRITSPLRTDMAENLNGWFRKPVLPKEEFIDCLLRRASASCRTDHNTSRTKDGFQSNRTAGPTSAPACTSILCKSLFELLLLDIRVCQRQCACVVKGQSESAISQSCFFFKHSYSNYPSSSILMRHSPSLPSLILSPSQENNSSLMCKIIFYIHSNRKMFFLFISGQTQSQISDRIRNSIKCFLFRPLSHFILENILLNSRVSVRTSTEILRVPGNCSGKHLKKNKVQQSHHYNYRGIVLLALQEPEESTSPQPKENERIHKELPDGLQTLQFAPMAPEHPDFYIQLRELDENSFPHLASISALSLTPPHMFSLDSQLGLFPGLENCRNPLLNDLSDQRMENHISSKKKLGRPKGQHSAPRGGPPRSWTNAELTEALQHVWNKKMTTSQASRIFGIPYNSLLMYVRGKYGKSLKLEQLKKECFGELGSPLDLLGLGNISNNNNPPPPGKPHKMP
uniref:BTB domain-containing protein n=1 Tax=Rhodnius prolixus TaxID=13249 RepID=T1HY62_RHOPR